MVEPLRAVTSPPRCGGMTTMESIENDPSVSFVSRK
jgi:hypothetical protein